MTKSRTILVAYSGCIYFEVAHALAVLSKSTDVVVATPDGKAARVGEGFAIAADVTFAGATVGGCSVILIPGGDIYPVKDDRALDRLLVEASHAGVVIGGICNGALLVAKSGILAGQRMTHVWVEKYAPQPEFAELLDYAAPHVASTTFCDEDVVVSGRIVTAKPWAHTAFGDACKALGPGPL